MGARRTARERALQALYQLEMTPGSVHDALEAAWAATEEAHKEPEAVKFARELVEGVRTNQASLVQCTVLSATCRECRRSRAR